jgi:hypothetical protein
LIGATFLSSKSLETASAYSLSFLSSNFFPNLQIFE